MTVNLSVECREDGVKLNLTSGGILVRTVKVFQECVPYNESEVHTYEIYMLSYTLMHQYKTILQADSHTDPDITQILYDPSTGNVEHQMQWERMPPSQSLLEDVVCSYHGCYETKMYEYDSAYYLTFTATSKCPFTDRIQGNIIG